MTRKTWQHIFKVQIPLSTNMDHEEVLIYNKDRSILDQREVTPELLALFPEGVYKIYVKGTFSQSGVIDLIQRVADQEW